MGTIFRIVLYAPDPAAAAKASRAAFDRIQALDNIMSDYKPGSELRQLCRDSSETASVFASSKAVAILSNSARREA